MTRDQSMFGAAILILAAGALAACSETADLDAETQAIQGVSKTWLEDPLERNAAAIAARFAADGVVLNPGSRPQRRF